MIQQVLSPIADLYMEHAPIADLTEVPKAGSSRERGSRRGKKLRSTAGRRRGMPIKERKKPSA
jgi:hypothetical protein